MKMVDPSFWKLSKAYVRANTLNMPATDSSPAWRLAQIESETGFRQEFLGGVPTILDTYVSVHSQGAKVPLIYRVATVSRLDRLRDFSRPRSLFTGAPQVAFDSRRGNYVTEVLEFAHLSGDPHSAANLVLRII